jgi:hypothetical protein
MPHIFPSSSWARMISNTWFFNLRQLNMTLIIPTSSKLQHLNRLLILFNYSRPHLITFISESLLIKSINWSLLLNLRNLSPHRCHICWWTLILSILSLPPHCFLIHTLCVINWRTHFNLLNYPPLLTATKQPLNIRFDPPSIFTILLLTCL